MSLVIGAVGLGLSALSAFSSYKGSKEAQRSSERAGQLNYDNIMLETTESIRRAEMQQEQAYFGAYAATGGSGVRMQGSPRNALTSMSNEFDLQNKWTKDAGQRRADIAKETGNDVGQAYKNQGISNAFSSASNIFTKDWWNVANTTG